MKKLWLLAPLVLGFSGMCVLHFGCQKFGIGPLKSDSLENIKNLPGTNDVSAMETAFIHVYAARTDDPKYDFSGTNIQFGNTFSRAFVRGEDAGFGPPVEQAAIVLGNMSSDGIVQSIGRFPYQKDSTITLQITLGATPGQSYNYVLEIDTVSKLPANPGMYLEDMYQKKVTPLVTGTTYSFQADAAKLETYQYRFKLLFK